MSTKPDIDSTTLKSDSTNRSVPDSQNHAREALLTSYTKHAVHGTSSAQNASISKLLPRLWLDQQSDANADAQHIVDGFHTSLRVTDDGQVLYDLAATALTQRAKFTGESVDRDSIMREVNRIMVNNGYEDAHLEGKSDITMKDLPPGWNIIRSHQSFKIYTDQEKANLTERIKTHRARQADGAQHQAQFSSPPKTNPFDRFGDPDQPALAPDTKPAAAPTRRNPHEHQRLVPPPPENPTHEDPAAKTVRDIDAGTRIAALAKANIGKQLWVGSGTGPREGCASSVSNILRQYGLDMHEWNIVPLSKKLESMGWQRDSFANRRPGDIIIAGVITAGHTGIVGETPDITYDNHSNTGQWTRDPASRWASLYPGLPHYVLHPPSDVLSGPTVKSATPENPLNPDGSLKPIQNNFVRTQPQRGIATAGAVYQFSLPHKSGNHSTPDMVVRVPGNFDPSKPIHLVVFNHGLYDNCDTAFRNFNLDEHMKTAPANTILVCPEWMAAPPHTRNMGAEGRNSSQGNFAQSGMFRTMLNDTFAQLASRNAAFRGITLDNVSDINIVAHSAGGTPAVTEMSASNGLSEKVTKVTLLAAYYSSVTEQFFSKWISDHREQLARSERKFYNFYDTSTTGLSVDQTRFIRSSMPGAAQVKIDLQGRSRIAAEDLNNYSVIVLNAGPIGHMNLPSLLAPVEQAQASAVPNYT
jgi:hypothetical protein